MSDILTVFGILLAVFTYIESLYHAEINWVINLVYVDSKIKRNNKSNYEKAKAILINNQIPLLILSLVISFLMLPESIRLVVGSFKYMTNGTAEYDVAIAAIIFINVCFAVISAVQIRKTIDVARKLKQLRYE